MLVSISKENAVGTNGLVAWHYYLLSLNIDTHGLNLFKDFNNNSLPKLVGLNVLSNSLSLTL